MRIDVSDLGKVGQVVNGDGKATRIVCCFLCGLGLSIRPPPEGGVLLPDRLMDNPGEGNRHETETASIPHTTATRSLLSINRQRSIQSPCHGDGSDA